MELSPPKNTLEAGRAELSPIPFFRDFATSGNHLCSEPVVAWAVTRGRAAVAREEQSDLWMRLGTEPAVDEIARRMGLEEIAPASAAEGDAVLLRTLSGVVLGVKAGEFSVATTGGRVHVGRFEITRAWSLK